MLFNSLAFLIFFPLVSAAFLYAPARFQLTLLVVASLGACAAAGPASCAWLIVLVVLGYGFGRRLERAPGAWTLALAVACVAAPLVVLKYASFGAESASAALGWMGVHVTIPKLDVAQPVGLSFYTFLLLGYLVDVHLTRAQAEPSLTRFAVFVAFFPKLVSGPVERAGTFLPQLDEPKRFDYARVTDGLRIMGWGFFKKLVVADRLGLVVDRVYQNPDDYRGLTLALVCLFYMFQVYYDFWAYSDIAVGAARVLGFDLTWNFNRPYASRSVSDYWRRWHISLTRCFFDYIFIPLSASWRRWGTAGVVVALMTTFVLSGLWHGAQWTFVVFGVLHGVALSLEHVTTRWRKQVKRRVPPRVYDLAAWAATFTFLACVDVFFRASTVGVALGILRRMFGGLLPDLAFLARRHFGVSALKTIVAGFPVLKIELVIAVLGIAVVELCGFLGEREPIRHRLVKQPVWARWTVYYAVAAALVFFGEHNATTHFVYMQF
jgi:D-alanyl-lipoteichoic acid acyltransferase DltB (MBOAT superfamily)